MSKRYSYMHFHVISIFPDTIDSYINESILGRALKNKLFKISKYPLRLYTKDKHKRVDGIPYGGGPGMVMWIDPIINVNKKIIQKLLKSKNKNKILIVNFNVSGKKFDTDLAKSIVNKDRYTNIVFICGRYEGVDDRVNELLISLYSFYNIKHDILNISIGDYVLTGGELPAMIMIDCISRQIDGVLHDKKSLEEERISCHRVFARPEVYNLELKKRHKDKQNKDKKDKNGKILFVKKNITASVPEVLLSGNHSEIDKWRQTQNLIKSDSKPELDLRA